MIDFEKEELVHIKEFNGGTGVVEARMKLLENGKIMKATLKKGSSIGIHTHTTNNEVIYVISGTAKCILDGEEEIVSAGNCHYCPKGSTHSIINEKEEELIIFCVVL